MLTHEEYDRIDAKTLRRKNGRVYNAETLDEIYPRERKLPAQFWQDVGLGGVRAGIR